MKWIPADLREELYKLTQERLSTAAKKNIQITDLYMDKDTGALCWMGMEEEGTLHQILQYNLRLLDTARRIDGWPGRFIEGAQARLQMAVHRGLETAAELDVEDILPWGEEEEDGEEEIDDEEDEADEIDEEHEHEEDEEKEEDEEEEDEKEDDEEEETEKEENKEHLGNIIEDVEIVGGQPGLVSGLEVYLAHDDDDDDDDDDLPLMEVELSISGEAWEHHFGSEGVLEVEMVDGSEEQQPVNFKTM